MMDLKRAGHFSGWGLN